LPLLLGGGYGLYLRYLQAAQRGEARLLDALPPARATNDLDLFLRTELLADSARLRPLRSALDRLGFTVIPSAQNYQFARKLSLGGQAWDIKVDLLARTPDPTRYPQVKSDARRVKPHPSVGLHAHRAPEAIATEEGAMPFTVVGARSSGEAYAGTIFLPSGYALLMMKLYALRDQWDKAAKGFGRKHALDLYTIVALMTEAEYRVSLAWSVQYQATEEAQEATRIVATLFGSETGIGLLRMREQGTLPAEADLVAFRELLHEFFPPG
jgi:hypothetical protein